MRKEIQKYNGNLSNPLLKKLDLTNLNTKAFSDALSSVEIPRLFYQLVIFLIDGSNSMREVTSSGLSKSNEVSNGIKSIVDRLKSSKNANSFDLCFIPFSDDYKDVYSVVNIKDISTTMDFNSVNFISPKGTRLAEALFYTENLVSEYYSKNLQKNCQVLIQILSDGAIHDYNESLKIIEKLKLVNKTTISCQYLQSHIKEGQTWYSWDEATGKIDYESPWSMDQVIASEKKISEKFKELATADIFFTSTINPEEIRKHMIKSISTVSKID
jgi:hypothetical protein